MQVHQWISKEARELGQLAEKEITPFFAHIDTTCDRNTEKVLQAFTKHRVSDMHFAGTTGYGYDDVGRDTLDQIYADIFGAESALVRLGFVNGTHALSCALFAILRPGDTMLSVTGAPYDTLQKSIWGNTYGNMSEYNIHYKQVDLLGRLPDYTAIEQVLQKEQFKLVFIQRSRGYAERKTLSCLDIQKICNLIKTYAPDTIIMVDNCYGEFVETKEPTEVGADLIAGSLIKNPGGGIAPTGGYIAGKKIWIDRVANRFTAPGIGAECGSTLGMNRLLYQGLFMAPHITVQALKTAIFASKVLELLGYQVDPLPQERRHDIIQTISFGNPKSLCAFCEGIQAGSPIDSHVTPTPWDMPGYDVQVIMAAGAFIQGASIELSADAPMRPPYTCYLQGGLTYSAGKLGILKAVDCILQAKM